jgi:hypothetical protein
MKHGCVIAVWVAVALLTGLFWAQVAYMCGAPEWAVGLVAFVGGVIVFGFGVRMVGAGEERQ